MTPRFDTTLRKPHGVSFSLSITLVFLSFSDFAFACTFFTLYFVKHKERHLKCKRICKLLSCFYFRAQDDVSNGKWNFTSLATRASARMNRLMGPLINNRVFLSRNYRLIACKQAPSEPEGSENRLQILLFRARRDSFPSSQGACSPGGNLMFIKQIFAGKATLRGQLRSKFSRGNYQTDSSET